MLAAAVSLLFPANLEALPTFPPQASDGPGQMEPSGDAARLGELIDEIAQRTPRLLPGGSYGIETATRVHQPTPDEEQAAIAHVDRMIRRAVVPGDAEEERLHEFWLNSFAGKGRIPRATMSAITDAELGDRSGSGHLEWESPTAWHHSHRTFNRRVDEAGLLMVWARNSTGFWRRQSDGTWTLEPAYEPPSYMEGLSSLREFLANVRWLCSHARRHATARSLAERPPVAPQGSIGFSVEVRDFSSLGLGRLDEGLSLPPGWRELAGSAELTLERSADGERLRLEWIDLDCYPVEVWTLWSQGDPRVPSLLRRQLFQLAGGRCLVEYEIRFQPLGPLEKSPEDFVPPPGSQVQDLRFVAPVSYAIPADGSLPDARAIDHRSRGLAAEVLDLMPKDPAAPNAHAGIDEASQVGVVADPAAGSALDRNEVSAGEKVGGEREPVFVRLAAILAGLVGANLIAFHLWRQRRRSRVRRAAPESAP